MTLLRALLRARSTGPTRTRRSSSSPTTSSSRSSGRAGRDRDSRQFLGGREELRGFIDAGDTTRLGAPRRCSSGGEGDVEFALGETRYDSGERIGTFLAVAQLDADGRMRRYMVARSPAIAFEPARGRCRA